MAQESILRIIIDSRNAERNARALASELDSIEKKGDFASKSMDSMSVATRQLAGYMAGVVTVGAAIGKMDTYTGIQNQLKLVTDSQAELNSAMKETFAIAQRSRSSWESVTTVYQKLAMNAKEIGLAQSNISKLTETVSKGIALSGSSAEGAASAITQLGQALGNGQLRGDEFNAVMENGYGLMRLLAEGMGVPIGQLKAMAEAGELTSEKVTKALLSMSSTADAEYAKTDATIKQSISELGNAITKFTGESGQASGAAQILTSSISMLGQNLEAVANIGMVGGVALLTKTIAAQTVAIHGSITEVMARRAADTAALQSQVQLAAVEVQRTRQATALAAQEIHLARQELNSATTRQARAAATMRLTQAEIAHSIALKQSASAVVAQTTVENALNASRSRSAMLLGLVGGPIGALTIGVAALTAGYMYLKSRTAEANAKLEEQAAVAKKAKDELLALKGLEKDNAVNDMAAAFERQNAALSESSSKINMQLNAIEQLYKGNKEVVQVVQDARNGTISMTEAVQRFNELRISKEVYESIKANTVEFEKNAKEAVNTKSKLNLFGVEVELSGRKAQTAAFGVDENSKSLDKNKTAAEKAAKAQAEFRKSLFDREFNAGLTKAMLAQGYNAEQINLISEYALKLQKEGKSITVEQVQYLLKINSIEEQNKKVIESRNASEKERTKELEKQQKVLQVNAKVQALAAKYNISTKEAANNIPKGLISAMIMQESRGDTYRNGKLLTSPAGAQGVGQFMPGTAKQYGVDVRSEESSINGMIKMMSALIKQFGGDVDKAIMAYNAGPGNVQNGRAYSFKETKNYLSNVKGYMAGSTGFKQGDISSKEFDRILEESTRVAIEQAKARTQLEVEVSSEVEKIRANLQEKLSEIDAANFTPERAKELKAEYQARADNDIAIAEYALKTKLDDYESFRKTESQLLEDSFNERKFYASRDLELTKEQRDKAVALLDEQLKQEQAALMLAKETRIFQANQAIYSEMELIQKRYELERRKIMEIQDLEERSALLAGSHINQAQDESALRDNTLSAYSNIMGYEESPLVQQFEVLQQMRELDLLNEEAYQNAKLQLQAKYTAGYIEGMLGGFASLVDENSKTYAVLFAAQKAFAVAQAMLNIPAAYSKAYDAVVGTPYIGPYIAPAVGAAAAALQVAQAASIKSTNMSGFKSGGYTGNYGVNQEAGVVHGQEYVLNAEATKRVGINTLNAINNGGTIQAEKVAQANAKSQQSSSNGMQGLTIINQIEQDDLVGNYMRGSAGGQIVLNQIKANPSEFRRALGVS